MYQLITDVKDLIGRCKPFSFVLPVHWVYSSVLVLRSQWDLSVVSSFLLPFLSRDVGVLLLVLSSEILLRLEAPVQLPLLSADRKEKRDRVNYQTKDRQHAGDSKIICKYLINLVICNSQETSTKLFNPLKNTSCGKRTAVKGILKRRRSILWTLGYKDTINSLIRT